MTTTEQSSTALAVREYPKLVEITGFSSAQINLVRQTVATGASIVEVAWYLYNARRLGLEPTLDQIYLIRYDRSGPADIVVGINGYRSMAEDSGAYAGSDPPEFAYEDVGQPKGAPSKATVTVWKMVQGVRCPFTAEARWEEFYPDHGKQPGRQGEQYRKRPHNQLAVRAESHALRKAFPYQARRLEPQAAPAEWIAAAEGDERAVLDSGRQRQLAADYQRIIGSNYDDDGQGTSAVNSPADAPDSSEDDRQVTDKKDPLWREWLQAEDRARQAGVERDTSGVRLPIAETSLRGAIADLLESITEGVG